MLELDLLVLIELLSLALLVWFLITQIIIPWRKRLPWFPAFRDKAELFSEEMEQFRRNQLLKEIERAKQEKAEADLEAELLETRRRVDERRQETLRRQK